MGSVMLLAVTNHITQNISSVPFLWVLPLALYLVSFVLAFDQESIIRAVATKTDGDAERAALYLEKIIHLPYYLPRVTFEALRGFTDYGDLVLAEASPSGYTELTRTHAVDGKCWSSPAISNGHIFARSSKEGVCLDVSSQTVRR